MNDIKSKMNVGKRIMSAVSAAVIGLSAFGGLRLTDLTASAAAGVYYDAGSFTVDNDRRMTKINTALSDPDTAAGQKMTLEDAAPDNITLKIVDAGVTFTGNTDYNYVAKGETNNGKISWNIKAWPADRISIGDSITKAEAASGWNSWFNDAAPRWEKESWRGNGSADTPWLTLTTTPFHEKSDVGYVTLELTKHDVSWTKSVSDTFTGSENDHDLPGFGNTNRDAPIYSGVGIIAGGPDTSGTSAKKFDELVKTISQTGNGTTARHTDIPTFAIPAIVREAWLASLVDVIGDTEDHTGKSLTGIRLENMKAKVTYDETTAPDKAWGSEHVYELDGVTMGSNKNKLWKTLDNFGVNDDSVTHFNLTGKNKQKITYSELPDKMITSYANDICKVIINGHEVCNTRISMKTAVNATWSYSSDLPRLTGTAGDTVDAPTASASNKSAATDLTNDTHSMTYSANAFIKNKVTYSGLTVGQSYTVTSTVYDISTGKQVLSPVSNEFTADDTGFVEVHIPVNSVIYGGKTFSVLAAVSDSSGVVCSYTNMTDTETQVMFPTVSGVLTASDITSKSVKASDNVGIIDSVNYSGLTPGRTYKITGYLLHKEKSAGSFDAGGSSVILNTQTVEFVPENSGGSVTVKFNVNTSDLSGQHLAVVESITDSAANAVVGEYKDVDDENRIVTVEAASKNDITLIIAIAAVVCAVIAVGFSVFVVVKNKRSK